MIENYNFRKYVISEDLSLINEALNRGYDVAIKRTDTGVKIIQEQAKVLKRTNSISCNREKITRRQNPI